MKEKVDVCIVGGGIVGLFTAAQLARQGLSIRLIDKQYIGSSRDNVGHISLHGHPKGLHDFATFCHQIWQTEMLGSAYNIGLAPTGSLMLAFTDDEHERLKRDHESALEQKEKSQYSTDIEAMGEALGNVRLAPETQAGRLASMDILVDTRRALDSLRKILIRQGVRIWGQDTVKQFLVDADGRVRGVEIANGEVCIAKHTIICAGVWAEKLLKPLGVHIPMRPARAHIFELSPHGAMPIPFVSRLYERGVVRIRQLPDGRALVAYDGLLDQKHAVWDKTVDPDTIAWLREEAGFILPALHHAPIHNPRAVLQAIPPDFVPYVGQYAGQEGLLLAVGMGGRSYAFAAGVADVMVSLVKGEAPRVDMTQLRADRFAEQVIPPVTLTDILPTYQPEPLPEENEPEPDSPTPEA